MDFAKVFDWILKVPRALSTVVKAKAFARQSLSTAEMQKWNGLRPRLEGLIRTLYPQEVTKDATVMIEYRNELALNIKVYPGATDTELLEKTLGIQFVQTDEEHELDNQQFRSDRDTAAENARNGQGGPNMPRRAQ